VRRVRAFPTTHQTVLERIRSSDAAVRGDAFGRLTEGYWRPAYHYVRRQWHLDPPEAEDVVQGFFAEAFAKHYVEKFDPAKARFRTFLRTCLDRFIQHDRDARQAQKRGGGAQTLSLDFAGAEQDLAGQLRATHGDPDEAFRAEVVRALCVRTIEMLKAELTAAGRARAYDVFACHDLTGDSTASYASVADALGLTVAQVTNDLHHARRRFRELALLELRGVSATESEFRVEARDLFGLEVLD
jgi:RNA polymerase sigma factor (sigma-70 family)